MSDRYLMIPATLMDDEEITDIGPRAAALFVAMLCRCRMLSTDGWLTQAQVAALGHPSWRRDVAKMIGVGLVTEHPTALSKRAYYLPMFLRYNPSQAFYRQSSAAGTVANCERRWHHPQPCFRPKCLEARSILARSVPDSGTESVPGS